MKKPALTIVTAIAISTPALAQSDPAMQENKAAMQKMMTAMEAVQDMDPDTAFAKKMKAHHQGAIDMADVELKYGRHSGAKDEARSVKTENEKSIKKLDAILAKISK